MSAPPQFPWLKWYPRDFASSTRGWPIPARGVYRELLDAQWDAGGVDVGTLPDDEEHLREIARATPAEWKVAWRFVASKFPQVEGGRRNGRLEEHRQESIAEYLGRSKGAALTNAKRWGHRNGRSASRSASRSLIAERVVSDVASESPPAPAPAPEGNKRLPKGGSELIRSKAVGSEARRVKP